MMRVLCFLLQVLTFNSAQNQTPENEKRFILITGSSDGIGRETARVLAHDVGNHIILHGRNNSRCQDVLDYMIQEEAVAQLSCVVGDHRFLDEVVHMAHQIANITNRLDVALLNAGIYPTLRVETANGFEETFQVNHLAHFLLAQKLLPLLENGAPSRLIFTGSVTHATVPNSAGWDDYNNSYDANLFTVYSRSKLCNVMTALTLSEQLASLYITVTSFHPGYVKTKLTGWRGDMNVREIKTPAFLCQSPTVQGVTGKYFDENRNEILPSSTAQDATKREKLWKDSTMMLREYL